MPVVAWVKMPTAATPAGNGLLVMDLCIHVYLPNYFEIFPRLVLRHSNVKPIKKSSWSEPIIKYWIKTFYSVDLIIEF